MEEFAVRAQEPANAGFDANSACRPFRWPSERKEAACRTL